MAKILKAFFWNKCRARVETISEPQVKIQAVRCGDKKSTEYMKCYYNEIPHKLFFLAS